jgi:hypothetical protein
MHDYLFVRPNGEPIDASDVNKFIQSAWKNYWSVERSSVAPHITSGIIRKSVIDNARQGGATREEQTKMARAMEHSLQTADRHYALTEGVRTNLDTHQLIASLYDVEEGADSSSEEEIEPRQHIDVPLADVEPSTASAKEVPVSSRLRNPNTPYGKDRVFNDADRSSLDRALKPYIEDCIAAEGRIIVSAEILGFLDRAGPGYAYLRLKYSEIQILNRVRATIREGRTRNCRSRGLSKPPSRGRKLSHK